MLLFTGCVTGCDLPGRPHGGPEVPRPDEVKSFDKLYGENCAGCHGAHGDQGVATNLANPVYQAIVDDATLRDVTAKGRKGTLMPGFSIQSGGELTDDQINVLVQGMRERWRKTDALGGQTPPPYKATHTGNAAAGQQVYAQACASCHGESAQKPGKAGSILDGSFLALIDEQTIRTTVIAGRPDIQVGGVTQPDWSHHIQGHPLTDDEITNVSAWMLSQRPSNPGQPYPNHSPTSEKPQEQQPTAVEK
jgi:cytochrome c oxidase cbb3-type subunit 3/ubiquinol-cytochrome c reductase cytochrome c subunit